MQKCKSKTMNRLNLTMTALAIALLLSIGAAMFLHAEDAAKPQWYKGNLHTHSLWSDGDDFPEMIADWYATHGYQFLALSDHNILSEGEKWMLLRDINRRGGPLALGKYQKRFGDEWVQTRGEGDKREVKLRPLNEFRKLIEKPGLFLMIQAEEVTDKFGKQPIHINVSNIQEVIKPQGGTSVQDVMTRNLKLVEEQIAKTGKPMLPHLNHPNFVWGVTAEDLAAVIFERFFEVYNGHPGVNQLGDATHPSIDRLWDIANTIRIAKMKSPPLFGVGTDDSHNYHGEADSPNRIKRAESGRGWVMVRAKELSAGAIINAMTRGDFYASSGITLSDVQFKDDTLTITIEPDGDATFTTQFIGTLKDHDDRSEPVVDKEGNTLQITRKYSADIGNVLAEVKGTSAIYKLTGNELYVRAIITSNKPPVNPSFKDQMKQAWTQPVGWEKWMK